jgi:hypothetical protein
MSPVKECENYSQIRQELVSKKECLEQKLSNVNENIFYRAIGAIAGVAISCMSILAQKKSNDQWYICRELQCNVGNETVSASDKDCQLNNIAVLAYVAATVGIVAGGILYHEALTRCVDFDKEKSQINSDLAEVEQELSKLENPQADSSANPAEELG